MIRIDESRLGNLTLLGEGGMAMVYRVGAPVPQVPGDLAFKKLKPVADAASRTQMLDAMRFAIDLRDAMSPAEQKELDEVTVWPLAIVADQGADVGLLMPCIPTDYFIDATPQRRVFEFQMLSASPEQAQANGYEQSRKPADKPLVRLALMARLAYAVEIIHRARGSRHLVYGDLSLRNAAVAINPPRIILMDCDGVADVSNTSRLQPNSPFFFAPELKTKHQRIHEQDQKTDVYKLGLCIIRGLATGRGATQLTDPASPLLIPGLLDSAGIDLLKRAVGDDRGQRPTAEEIKDHLVGRVLALANPPSLLSAQLSTNVVLRGSEVFVRWTHQGGAKVRIYSDVNNFEVKDLDADAHPHGYPIKPPTACEIRVVVSNDHGEVEGSAGRLHYYEVPPPQISITMPSVSLPDLPAMRLPMIRPDLPAYPIPAADIVDVPRPRWPQMPSLNLAAVVPKGAVVHSLRKLIGHAYRAADAGIDRAVGDVLRRDNKKLRLEAEKKASNP